MTCIMGRCFTYTPSLFTFSPHGTYLGLGSPNYTSFSMLPEEATNVQTWPCPCKTYFLGQGKVSSSIQDSLSLHRKGSQKNNIARSSHSLKPFLFGSTSRIFIYARGSNVNALCEIFLGISYCGKYQFENAVHVCGVTNLTLACQYLRELVNLRPGENKTEI